jgi:hypothetical protein
MTKNKIGEMSRHLIIWPSFDRETQQPTKGQQQQWVRGGDGGKLGDKGGMRYYPIVWAIKVSIKNR